MQSVTAIICRERRDGGWHREEKKGEEKRRKEKAIIRRREGTKEEWPKFRATLYRLRLLNFMRRSSFLSFSFFFTELRAPLKRDTRATFRCTATRRDYVWMRSIFMRANRRETRITSSENFRDAITWATLPHASLMFYFSTLVRVQLLQSSYCV